MYPKPLQTTLFTLSGTGSFIFTLSGIEFIRKLNAYTLPVTIDTISVIRVYSVNIKMIIASTKNIISSQR